VITPAAHSRQTPRGFTLVEVLVAVAITAVLVVAMAAAFQAAVQAQQSNQGQIAVANRAQTALNSILARARMTPFIAPKANGKHTDWENGNQDKRTVNGVQKDNGVADTTGLTMSVDATPAADPAALVVTTSFEYAYDATTQQLTVSQDKGTPVVLVDHVTAFEARLFPTKSEKAKRKGKAANDISSELTITMTVEGAPVMADEPKPKATVVGSAVPRGAVWQGRQTSYPIDELLNDPNNRKKPATP
jgi:prepilin-type N-terminal cleavage/methylation domain-containing protein